MTTKWNNREYRFETNSENGNGYFQEHNERMRQFRGAHANIAMVNAPRLDEPALLESMERLQARCTIRETGGSRLAGGTTDWSALVPVLKVAQYKLSQN